MTQEEILQRNKRDSETMIRMNEARIYVDLNEREDVDIFLLSKDDTKEDSLGNIVTFYEGMPIRIWSDDGDDEGNEDDLLADAVAIKRPCSWPPHVKWCCRVDLATLMHESEYNARKL